MALQLQRFGAKICECLYFKKCTFLGSLLAACLCACANMHQMSKGLVWKSLVEGHGLIIVSHARLSAASAFCLCIERSRFAVLTNVSMVTQVNTGPACVSLHGSKFRR